MMTSEELINEYMEHYECAKIEAIKMALDDLRLAEKELIRLGAEELLKEGDKRDS